MAALKTIPDALADAARLPAGITFLHRDRETTRSYAELRAASLGVAHALAAAGLRRGDLVAIVIADSERFLTALLGASIAGLLPALITPPATMIESARYFEGAAGILRAAGARAVVTDAALTAGFDRLRATCPDLALVLDRAALDLPGDGGFGGAALDDLALVQFTSGSTSSPKGVALSHRNIAANVAAVNGPAGLDTRPERGDVAVSWLPLYHDMGLVGMTLGAIYSRVPLYLLTPQAFVKRPTDWLRAITRYRGTISYAPSFAYELCVRRVKDRDVDELDLSSWRIAGCGAEPIHAPTLAAFAAKFAGRGFRADSLLPSYGLAEHVVAAAMAPRDRAIRVGRFGEDEIVSCGKPLEGHQVRILADGRPAADGEVGEIVLAGPSVMVGYYRQDALTASTIRDGWLHTGDLGYLSGGELFVCGRAKDVIIANGRKYHPQDLEWSVDDLEGVRRGRVVAFGVGVPGRADRIVVMVEPKGLWPIGAVCEAVRRRIGDAFGLVVDDVVCVPSGTIGRTTSGKLRRAAAKAAYLGGELLTETVR